MTYVKAQPASSMIREMDMGTEPSTDHIFVVGASRSGTSWLGQILTQHSDIHICYETHFMNTLMHRGVLREIKKLGDLRRDENVTRLLDSLFSGKVFGTFWLQDKPWEELRDNLYLQGAHALDRESVERKILDSQRTPREIYQIIMDEFAQVSGKGIGGDKTTSNVFHVDTLLEWYPGAKVIHIIRDPRAVLISMFKHQRIGFDLFRRFTFLHRLELLVQCIVMWYLAIRKHCQYLKNDDCRDRYYYFRYEDLYGNYNDELKRMFAFLDIECEPNLLEDPTLIPRTTTDYDSKRRYENVDKWKGQIPNWMRVILEFALKRKMALFNY